MQRIAGRKFNSSLQLAAVLFCCTLISVYLVSGMFARYTADGEALDNAVVAKFAPAAKIWDDTWQYDEKDESRSFDYKIILTNKSEVTVRSALKITFPDDVLEGAVFSMEKEDGTTASYTMKDAETINFGKIKDLPYNFDGEESVMLTVKIDEKCYERIVTEYSVSSDDIEAHFNAEVAFTQVD